MGGVDVVDTLRTRSSRTPRSQPVEHQRPVPGARCHGPPTPIRSASAGGRCDPSRQPFTVGVGVMPIYMRYWMHSVEVMPLHIHCFCRSPAYFDGPFRPMGSGSLPCSLHDVLVPGVSNRGPRDVEGAEVHLVHWLLAVISFVTPHRELTGGTRTNSTSPAVTVRGRSSSPAILARSGNFSSRASCSSVAQPSW